VNRAWKVGASVASTTFAVVLEPSVVVPAVAGRTPRYVLPRKLRLASWAAVAINHHYPTHQNHWGYFTPV
jgi:hypothetical protein